MPISTRSTSQGTGTVEVDALVAGAGAAGVTAALVGSLEGLDVLLAKSPTASAAPPRPRPVRSGCLAPGRVAKPVLRIMSLTRSDISMR
jgi:hypothetical protein